MARAQTIDRNQVLEAAEHIVLSRGAAELTIDAVARAAGITKGGVQYCFGTKQGLVQAMVERWCRDLQAEINAMLTPVDDPVAMMAAYVEATARINKVAYARAAGLLAMLLQSPEQMQTVRQWYQDHFKILDPSTELGRRGRFVFMAIEGAFMLRMFGFLEMDDAQWLRVFEDIKAMLPVRAPAPRKKPGRPRAPRTKKSPATGLRKQAASTL